MNQEKIDNTSEFLSVIDETNMPDLKKIFALSDIHGDILPLIIQLRDCAKVIRKKHTVQKKSLNALNLSFTESIQPDLFSDEFIENDFMLRKSYNDPQYEPDLGYEWIADDTILVVVGDVLDNFRNNMTIAVKSAQIPDNISLAKNSQDRSFSQRYGEYIHEELKIIAFLQELHSQAIKLRSRIIILSGNHEVMNMIGEEDEIENYNSQYNLMVKVYDDYTKEFVSRTELFRPGKLGNRLFNKHNNFGIMVKVYDYVFVHGGFSLESSKSSISIERLNKVFLDITTKGAKLKVNSSRSDNNSLKLTRQNSHKYDQDLTKVWQILLNTDHGLLWERGLANPQIIDKYHKNRRDLDAFCNNLRKIVGNLCDNTFKKDISLLNESCKDKLKIVVGHCIQSDVGNTYNKNTTYSNLLEYDDIIEKLGAPVAVGSITKLPDKFNQGGIFFGMSMECGKLKEGKPDNNNPTLFRIDHSPSRAFDSAGLQNALTRNYNEKHNIVSYTQISDITKQKHAEFVISEDYMRRLPQVMCFDIYGNNHIIRSSLKNMIKNIPRAYNLNIRDVFEKFLMGEYPDAITQLMPYKEGQQILQKKAIEKIQFEKEKLAEEYRNNMKDFANMQDAMTIHGNYYQMGGNLESEKNLLIRRLINKIREYKRKIW